MRTLAISSALSTAAASPAFNKLAIVEKLGEGDQPL
jgi:hypothetical protein